MRLVTRVTCTCMTGHVLLVGDPTLTHLGLVLSVVTQHCHTWVPGPGVQHQCQHNARKETVKTSKTQEETPKGDKSVWRRLLFLVSCSVYCAMFALQSCQFLFRGTFPSAQARWLLLSLQVRKTSWEGAGVVCHQRYQASGAYSDRSWDCGGAKL